MTRFHWLAMLGSVVATAASAQRVELAASDALQCLTPDVGDRGRIEYPFAPWKSRVGARLKLELDFRAPDRRPNVTVVDYAVDAPDHMEADEFRDAFVSAVKKQVGEWRVPCLPEGGLVKLLQEFVFAPSLRKVFWSDAVDSTDGERKAHLACLHHESGQKAPEYSMRARQDGISGNVLTELVFEQPDQPPVVTTHARPRARQLAWDVERWAAGYRLPCLPLGEKVAAHIVFSYRFYGEAAGLKPMTLMTFLPFVKGIRDASLALDTSTMGCPFDVRFQYFQPDRRNAVGSDAQVAERRPVLEWLRTVELNLPSRSLDVVFGDETTIAVPCIKIDLKPKEPSS